MISFDRIVLRAVGEDGHERLEELSPDAFLALPLSVRIKSVLDRSARFFDGDTEVDARAALAQLRQHRAAALPA